MPEPTAYPSEEGFDNPMDTALLDALQAAGKLISQDLTWPIKPPREPWEMPQPWFGTPSVFETSAEPSDCWVAPDVGEDLFEDAGWHISKNDNKVWDTLETDSVMWHYCENTLWREYVSNVLSIDLGMCSACHNKIPESVLTIWKLQNLDSLPLSDDEEDFWCYNGPIAETSSDTCNGYFDEECWAAANEG
jgi:hypothetical protein